MEEAVKLVDIHVIAMIAERQIRSEGQVSVDRIIEEAEAQGFVFGFDEDLVELAKKQKVKSLIGRIRDKGGKRRYISAQGVLDFGSEFVYCPAAEVQSVRDKRKQSLDWIYKHIMGLINKSPLIPQEIAENIARHIKSELSRIA